MEYLKLGEVFKINVNDKTVYLKVEPDGSQSGCDNCYFYEDGNPCNKTANCSFIDKNDDTNIIYKEINPVQDVFIIFSERRDGFVKECGVYPTEEDAKKKVEELNKNNIDVAHHYEKIQYYPYGIITDIKEVKL